MKTILNYVCTKHFEKRMIERKIDAYIVSLCLVYGKFKEESSKHFIVSWSVDQIKKRLDGINFDLTDLKFTITLFIVIDKNKLITIYTRKGDIGL